MLRTGTARKEAGMTRRRYEVFVFGNGEDWDNVPRLNAFRAAHPEWSVGHDSSSDLWRAHRELENGGSEEYVATCCATSWTSWTACPIEP